MKLKVLVDNNTFIDDYYLAEPAVCYYIEDENVKILFDTGYSDVVIKNAQSMGIDLSKLDNIVISHGHNDHTGGLKYLFENIHNKNIRLIVHPESLNSKFYGNEYIGTSMSKQELEKVCNLELTNKALNITNNITFLGEIPQINNFEKREIIGKCCDNGDLQDDIVIDDTALVYKSSKGLFIITGCSHSGICNIVEYAKKVCNEDKIYGIIGGFHLFENNERLEKTIEYLKNNSIELLYPCHCVSLKAKIEIGKVMEIYEVGVGLEINL